MAGEVSATDHWFRLDGRVAVVTGAAQGIGAATARLLAAAGADLAVCDRNTDDLVAVADGVRRTGRQVVAAGCDVRDADQVAAFVDEVAATWPHVDVLVNNAGGGFAAPFLDVTPKGQDALVAENFGSVTILVRAVVPLMPPATTGAGDASTGAARGGGGSIVNITSIEAHRAAPGFAVYAAMKAAVANLTKSLALELGPAHIRVNCVAPDVIPTPGIGGDLPVTTPLPYAGHPDDVAAAVLYLAADASRFVTGTTLPVDGGNGAAGGWRRGDAGTYTT